MGAIDWPESFAVKNDIEHIAGERLGMREPGVNHHVALPAYNTGIGHYIFFRVVLAMVMSYAFILTADNTWLCVKGRQDTISDCLFN